jgi:hypothetical protein
MNFNESQKLTDAERNYYTFFQAVNCTEDNFIISEDKNYDPDYSGKNLFDEWDGYSLICPKISDDIVIKGTEQRL